MKYFSILAFLGLLALGTSELTAQNSQSPTSNKHVSDATTSVESAGTIPKTTVESFMQHMYGWIPRANWKVLFIGPSEAAGIIRIVVYLETLQEQRNISLFVTPDGEHVINGGELMPFGEDPFVKARGEILKNAKGPSRGPDNAQLVIVEFGDLQCPSCKVAQPQIEQLLKDNSNSRLIFQNFPLPMHNWAFSAALWSDCVGRTSPVAFWKFVAETYEKQNEISPDNVSQRLYEIANVAGADAHAAAECATQPETRSRVEESIRLGRKLGVMGTPILFLNGRRTTVNDLSYEQLNSLARFQAKQ